MPTAGKRRPKNRLAWAFAVGSFYLAAYIFGVATNDKIDWNATAAGVASFSVVAGAANLLIWFKILWAEDGELGAIESEKLTVLLGIAFSMLITFGSAFETLAALYRTDEPITSPFLEGMLPLPRPDFMR